MLDANFLIQNGVNLKQSLELFGDMDTYNDNLDEFLKDVTEKVEKLTGFKEHADMANYAILVHSIKSDAKYFGFDKLAEIAFNHEQESKNNNMFYVYDHYDELKAEVNRIVNKLKEDAKKFNNKLKNSMLIFGKGETEKTCECIIF